MQTIKEATIIEGKLCRFLDGYVKEFRETGQGFEEFPDEAILYSLLEYSRFPRPFTNKERIIYIHDKCLEYMNIPHYSVNVNFDDWDYFYIIVNGKCKQTKIIKNG